MKMKKGLLSLLAVALTIVSCQDYDDQFAELTGLVNTLSTKVAGIETSTANLAALSVTVSGLQAAIAAIPTTDSTADLTAVSAGLDTIQDDIDAIELILAGGVASADDLADIDALIDTLQEGVNTLLTNNQSISVNITIVDSETLATAQGYIEIGATTPAGYLLGGNLLVDHDGLTGPEIVTANQMTAKLISVSGTVSVTGAVDLSGLSYIALAYTKNGLLTPLDSSITSLGAGLNIDGRIGAIVFPNLTSVLGNVAISNHASVTSIDFSNVTVVGGTSTIDGGTTALASATTADFGKFKMIDVTLNSATSVNLGQSGTIASLSIVAPRATSISANSQEIVTGVLDINSPLAATIDMNALTGGGTTLDISAANSTTVIHFDKLTSAGIIDANQNEVKEFHMGSMVTTGAGTVYAISAMTVALTKLTTIPAATTFTLNATTISAPALATIAGSLNIAAASTGLSNVNLPLAAVTGSLTSLATSTTILSTDDATLAKVLKNSSNTALTLKAQSVVVTGGNGIFSDTALLSLTLTGKADAAGTTYPSFTHTVANFAVLKYLNVADLNVVTVPTTSLVATMTTFGKINDISIIDADLMTGLTIGHGHHTYTDAPAQSVVIQNMALLTSVDLSTVTKLDNALIGVVANPLLATITAPALGSPLLANGAVSLLISANALVATATAAEPGTALAEVKSPSLTGWKAYIGQMVTAGICTNVGTDTFTAAGGTMVVGIDFDKNGAAGTYVYETFSAGTNPLISGADEVALIDNND